MSTAAAPASMRANNCSSVDSNTRRAEAPHDGASLPLREASTTQHLCLTASMHNRSARRVEGYGYARATEQLEQPAFPAHGVPGSP